MEDGQPWHLDELQLSVPPLRSESAVRLLKALDALSCDEVQPLKGALIWQELMQLD